MQKQQQVELSIFVKYDQSYFDSEKLGYCKFSLLRYSWSNILFRFNSSYKGHMESVDRKGSTVNNTIFEKL